MIYVLELKGPLEMYRENNIEFRIASADAIGRFKLTQANSFLQVCRKEFDFDISAREIVLLSYDTLYGWLMQMEKVFLREEQRTPSSRLREHVISSFKEQLAFIESTCSQHPNIFTPSVVEFIKVIHSYAPHLMKIGVNNSFIDTPSARAFTRLASLLSDYLQHVLICMHEFNNNIVLEKEPFVCVNDFCMMQRINDTDSVLTSLQSRATYFRMKVHDRSKVFLLKNYTKHDLRQPAVEMLADIGIFAKSEQLETAE
jgi:hypothetical protein